jgi:hypothetical protein
MSSEPPEPPERWRALALEARNLAAHMTDLEAKLVMLSIARIYERLAVLAQAREQKKDTDISE